MRGIRTITFDLDDTLWPIAPAIARAEKRVHAWLAEHYPRVTEMFTPEAMLEVRAEVIEQHGDRIHDLMSLRRMVLGRVSKAAGYGTRMVDDAFAIFSEERNIVEVFPDVRPTLSILKGSYTLIAVTNGNADLSKIGLRDLFDEVISATTAGAAKPSPEIFDKAVRAGGAQADETLHVGDHPEADVHGAIRAGLKAVWVNRNGDGWPEDLPEPDGIIEDIASLADLLGVTPR